MHWQNKELCLQLWSLVSSLEVSLESCSLGPLSWTIQETIPAMVVSHNQKYFSYFPTNQMLSLLTLSKLRLSVLSFSWWSTYLWRMAKLPQQMRSSYPVSLSHSLCWQWSAFQAQNQGLALTQLSLLPRLSLRSSSMETISQLNWTLVLLAASLTTCSFIFLLH